MIDSINAERFEGQYFLFRFSSSYQDDSICIGSVRNGRLSINAEFLDSHDVANYLRQRDVKTAYTYDSQDSFLGMHMKFFDPDVAYSYDALDEDTCAALEKYGLKIRDATKFSLAA